MKKASSFKRFRAVLMLLVSFLVILQITLLKPSRIETAEEEPLRMYPSIETQLEAQRNKDEIKYTLTGVVYSSTESGQKQWLMKADQAVMLERTNLLVADQVEMLMYDPQEKTTEIQGNRAYFSMTNKELDLEGDVNVLFPDNFRVRTSKAHYSGVDQRFSTQDPFYSESKRANGETLRVWGDGFLGSKTDAQMYILNNARVQMKRANESELTDLRSDRAQIDRIKKFGEFTMASPDRYVESNQGTLFIRSKTQTASYDSNAKELQYLTALDDVMIKETDPKKLEDGLKYSTSQKAEFYTQQNKILLSGFPSVYQRNDTVTGELITVFRDRNLVEVTDANAYHEDTNP